SPNRPLQGALVVADAGPIRTVADLRGARVAFPAPAWPAQLVAGALDQAGLTIADVTVVQPDGDEDLQALLRGEVEAATLLGPRLIEAEETGRIRHLVPTDSAVCNRHLFTTTREFALRQQDALSLILTAMEKANLWVKEDFARAAAHRAQEQRYEAPKW